MPGIAWAKWTARIRAEKLDKPMKKFGERELTDQEIRDLLRDQEEITDAMRLLLTPWKGKARRGTARQWYGAGKRPPGGRRPIAERSRDQDPQERSRKSRGQPQGACSGSPATPAAAISRKSQPRLSKAPSARPPRKTPEALDRQRIPDDAADIATRYFNKLGNQKSKALIRTRENFHHSFAFRPSVTYFCVSSTFGEKKRTSGPSGREGIVGGPFFPPLRQFVRFMGVCRELGDFFCLAL